MRSGLACLCVQEADFTKAEAQLVAQLKKDGIKMVDNAQWSRVWAGYDSPFGKTRGINVTVPLGELLTGWGGTWQCSSTATTRSGCRCRSERISFSGQTCGLPTPTTSLTPPITQ
jgi:hypothetical protein